MSETREQRSIRLLPDVWKALDEIAKETGLRSNAGAIEYLVMSHISKDTHLTHIRATCEQIMEHLMEGREET